MYIYPLARRSAERYNKPYNDSAQGAFSMKQKLKDSFLYAFQRSMPIMIGYFALGSANGILRLAHRRMEHSSLPSPLRNMESITCKDIFDLSAQGDTLALEIREEYFDFLGQFLANVCCVVDPEAVILGGGVSKAGQPLLEGVRKYFLSYMFHTGREIVFALAKLGNDAGIYGGFQMARDGFGR